MVRNDIPWVRGVPGGLGRDPGGTSCRRGGKATSAGGQSYFLSNGWSKSIVLENKVAINFDFRSGAKKSGHLDYPFQSYGQKVITPPKKRRPKKLTLSSYCK